MNEEIDLLDLFYAFWNKRVLIIIVVIIGAFVGLFYTRYAIKPKYTSSVTLILGKSSNSSSSGSSTLPDSTDSITQSDIALNQKLISTYSEIMKSRKIINQVIKNLDLNMTYSQINNGVKVSSVKDSDVIKLSITSRDPELSAKIADEMTSVFVKEIASFYNIQNVFVIDGAEINRRPVNVSYPKNAIIFALAAFAICAVIIFLFYYFDNTIKTEENIEKLTDLPVLASIPNVTDMKGGK